MSYTLGLRLRQDYHNHIEHSHITELKHRLIKFTLDSNFFIKKTIINTFTLLGNQQPRSTKLSILPGYLNYIFISAKEVIFLRDFVCLFVFLFVNKITQKVMDGSFWNFEVMSRMVQATRI